MFHRAQERDLPKRARTSSDRLPGSTRCFMDRDDGVGVDAAEGDLLTGDHDDPWEAA